MKFGIFSNGQRHRDNIGQSWDDDIHEIVVCDKLGLQEAWVSEHTGLPYLEDAVPAAEPIIAKASALTEQIRLGPAVRRTALLPPMLVAMEATVCDHLTGGRYMLGIGVGGPIANHEHWGLPFSDAHAMTSEGIELILKCWERGEPFDFNGKYYHGKNISLYPKPLQQPRIPVAIATTRGILLDQAARHGFRLLTGQFGRGTTSAGIAQGWDEACLKFQGRVRRRDVTAVRGIFIAETDAQAFEQVESDWNKHLEYNKRYFAPVFNEYIPTGGNLDDVTFGRLIDENMIFIGSAATVQDRIRNFYKDIGGFGTFLFVGGKDWGTKAQRDDSYHRFAERVMPGLRDLDKDLDQPGVTLPIAHAA
jgi:alkanesulfonate monooxygenase SsuD/methylene tetrahydromethanopterin reductase-like flavin-dependent oxidoreductase (luciferase family)